MSNTTARTKTVSLAAGLALIGASLPFLACDSGGGTGGGPPTANANANADTNANGPDANANGSDGNTNSSNENTNAAPANDNGGPPAEARWLLVHQDLPAALLSVQVVSNGDVYAVGTDAGEGDGPYVLRYDGTQWTRSLTGSTGDLWWTHEVSADDIWMCGESRLVLRFHPSTGQFVPSPPPAGSEALFGIWGVAPDDVWAVGGTTTRGVLLHFDGTNWTEVDLSGAVQDGLVPPLLKVWGASRDDVYFVGFGGVILHYDGAALTLQPTGNVLPLFTVHGDAAGATVAAVGGLQPGEILELINNVWTDVSPAGVEQVNGVNFGASGVALAVGVHASTFRRSEDGWTNEENGLTGITDLDFHAVWVAPSGAAWAVGGSLVMTPQNRGIVAYYGQSDPRGPITLGE